MNFLTRDSWIGRVASSREPHASSTRRAVSKFPGALTLTYLREFVSYDLVWIDVVTPCPGTPGFPRRLHSIDRRKSRLRVRSTPKSGIRFQSCYKLGTPLWEIPERPAGQTSWPLRPPPLRRPARPSCCSSGGARG